jgi:hypothetical protein
MKKVINFISGMFLFYIFFLAIKWYIKGHFGKQFIFFWLFTLFSMFSLLHLHKQQEKNDIKYDNRSGYEMWQDNN